MGLYRITQFCGIPRNALIYHPLQQITYPSGAVTPSTTNNVSIGCRTFIGGLCRAKDHDVEVAHVLLRRRRADSRRCTNKPTQNHQNNTNPNYGKIQHHRQNPRYIKKKKPPAPGSLRSRCVSCADPNQTRTHRQQKQKISTERENQKKKKRKGGNRVRGVGRSTPRQSDRRRDLDDSPGEVAVGHRIWSGRGAGASSSGELRRRGCFEFRAGEGIGREEEEEEEPSAEGGGNGGDETTGGSPAIIHGRTDAFPFCYSGETVARPGSFFLLLLVRCLSVIPAVRWDHERPRLIPGDYLWDFRAKISTPSASKISKV